MIKSYKSYQITRLQSFIDLEMRDWSRWMMVLGVALGLPRMERHGCSGAVARESEAKIWIFGGYNVDYYDDLCGSKMK